MGLLLDFGNAVTINKAIDNVMETNKKGRHFRPKIRLQKNHLI